jgi:hypothetical protein
MEELLKACAKEFESGNPEKACDLLLHSLSSNDPDPIILSDSSPLIKLFQQLLWQLQSLPPHFSPDGHKSIQLLSSSQLSLQFHLLEIVAWLMSSDFCYDSNIRHTLSSTSAAKEILSPLIEYLLIILRNQSLYETSTIGHVYFILSTQALPDLFSPFSASFIHEILRNYPKETKNPLKKYALRALLGILRSCGSTHLPPLDLSHIDLLSEWRAAVRNENGNNHTSSNGSSSDELCEFVNLWKGDLSKNLTTSAIQSAKQLMSQLRSALP